MQLTADGSSQTPATATATATAASTTAATTTDAQADTTTPLASPVPPPSPPGGSPPSRRIILGLLAVVVMLLGTNAYSHNQGRALKVRTEYQCISYGSLLPTSTVVNLLTGIYYGGYTCGGGGNSEHMRYPDSNARRGDIGCSFVI